MITVGSFVEMFVVVYVSAIVLECISRLSYYRDPPRMIIERFRSILIRSVILTTVFMISLVVWTEMGWMPNKAR